MNRDRVNACLTELGQTLASSPIEVEEQRTVQLFRVSLKRLREADIAITKPDKSNGVV